ncbi:MAG: EAL domain-containing protein [Acidimicrobiia bacterium]
MNLIRFLRPKHGNNKRRSHLFIGPILASIVVALVSVSSWAAQVSSDNAKNREIDKKIESEAKKSIESIYKKIEDINDRATKTYDSDHEKFKQNLYQFSLDTRLKINNPSIAFISYVEPFNGMSNQYQIKFSEPPFENFTQNTNNDSIIGKNLNKVVSTSDEISDSIRTGSSLITHPFLNNYLIDGQSAYIAVITPVYEKLPTNPNEKDRISAYRGSLVTPIALNIFLNNAQAKSKTFRVFKMLDKENEAIASSNSLISNDDLTLHSAVVKIDQRKFRLAYDDYYTSSIRSADSRQQTLITGLGLAVIVFLLFLMLRVNERRAKKLKEKAQEEVEENEARFSALIKQSSDIIIVLSSQGLIKFVSPSIWYKLGYKQEQVIGKNLVNVLNDSETKKIAVSVLHKLNKHNDIEPFEIYIKTRENKKLTFECVVNDLRNDPAIKGIVINARDITERKLAEAQVAKAKALYENALENAPVGVALVHKNNEIFFCNEALENFVGKRSSDLLNTRLRDLILTDDQFAFSDMWKMLEARGPERTTKELRFTHPDGRQRWGFISAQSVYDDDIFQYYVVQIEDTTERRSIAERLEYQAIHDPLTGLPNRLLFVDRLEVALQRAKRSSLGVTVLFLDLDRFKVVNDSLGHAAGDRLLESVSERIKSSVRPNDTIARFGGDEFVILCEDISDERQTQEIADRLLENINRPIMLVEGEVYVTASIGIARSLSGEDTPETILRDADTAMYRAKDAGRNRSEIFDERTHARAVANLETGNGMFRALTEHEFRMRYQPIISLASGRLSGFEALVYWEHPERGHIGPSDFIPLAEETGVIIPLGLQIFEEACNELHRWHQFSANASHLTMSINLSPRQLSEPTFVEEVRKILKRSKVNPSRIWFEITESALMVDANSTIAMLDQLKNLGVHFEVDDFGTGFSSLSYLKKFPVDALKIDQGFIDGLGRDPEDSAIVTAVVSLSHALGLQAIAEGVETPLQMAELKTLGCEYAQGYLFARPALAKHWDKSVQSNELFKFEDQLSS